MTGTQPQSSVWRLGSGTIAPRAEYAAASKLICRSNRSTISGALSPPFPPRRTSTRVAIALPM